MTEDSMLLNEDYYSVGGGFVAHGDDIEKHNVFRFISDGQEGDHKTGGGGDGDSMEHQRNIEELDALKEEMDDLPPMLFTTSVDLFRLARAYGMNVSQLVYENEKFWRSEEEIQTRLMKIWNVMNNSIEKGMKTRGILPGEIQETRRAPTLMRN